MDMTHVRTAQIVYSSSMLNTSTCSSYVVIIFCLTCSPTLRSPCYLSASVANNYWFLHPRMMDRFADALHEVHRYMCM